MKYKFSKEIQETDFRSINELIYDAIDTAISLDNDYDFITIVADSEMAEKLIKTLSNTTVNGFELSYRFLDYDTEYNDMYYVSIAKNGELSCEKAWHEKNQWHDAGYLYNESSLTYIRDFEMYEDIVNAIDGNILVYGLDNE